MVESSTKISRIMYWLYIEKSAPKNFTTKLLWEQDFDCLIEDSKWFQLSKMLFKITPCVKLRLFQYKITQRCLITNIHLFHYGIKDSKLCTFCNRYTETIVHLFWDCPVVRNFWTQVERYLQEHCYEDRFDLNSSQMAMRMLFNKVVSNPVDYLNTIILIAKRYIYVARCATDPLSLHACLNSILKYKKTELYVAAQNHKMDKYNAKWARMATLELVN